jgi:hypothetical protein
MKHSSTVSILLSLALAAVLSGCTNVDGGYRYIYHASWNKATENDKRPETIGLVVSLSHVAAYRLDAMSVKFPQAGELQGKVASGITWGYTAIFGIPLGDTRPPIPPPIDSLYLYIDNGKSWKEIVVPLAAESQRSAGRGWRQLELENISERLEQGLVP